MELSSLSPMPAAGFFRIPCSLPEIAWCIAIKLTKYPKFVFQTLLRKELETGGDLRVGEGVFVDRLLAEAEVSQLDVAFGVQQNIFRLQVTVDDALAVQVLQRQRDLGHVEASLEESQRHTLKIQIFSMDSNEQFGQN